MENPGWFAIIFKETECKHEEAHPIYFHYYLDARIVWL